MLIESVHRPTAVDSSHLYHIFFLIYFSSGSHMSSCEDVEKFFEGLKSRVDEAERSLKELQEKIESLRKLEKNAEEDILKRFGRKTDLLKSAMDSLFGDLRGELIELQSDMIKRINGINEKIDDVAGKVESLADGLDRRVGSLKNEMRDAVEYFVGKVNNIIYDFSSAVNKETAKIVRNVDRVADMSNEMIKLRKGQRRLLTLIIIQMILQMIMIYLFFFR